MSPPGVLQGHAFISYAREDAARADRLQRILEAAGITVWRDTADLWPGQDWQARIRRAITDNALVFLACFSRRSVSRRGGYQKEELALAVEQLRLHSPNQEWLIPVRFDDCQIPDSDIGAGRRLAALHSADLFGDNADIAISRLVGTIVSVLGRGTRAGPWQFPGSTPITIACAERPKEMVDLIPYSSPSDPHHTEMSGFADTDSLIVLNSHVCALNRGSPIRLRAPSRLSADDYQTHLVALGGIDWNALTRKAFELVHMPVRQVADWSAGGGQYFEVKDNGMARRYRPVTEKTGHLTVVREDVALFARAASPFRRGCTLTICCGMHTPGTFGIVRALIDPGVRDCNIDFLRSQFGDSDAYCVLTRIPVVDGRSIPPDWTLTNNVLYTWSR